MNLTVICVLSLVSTLTLLTLALRVVKWTTLVEHHWAADIVFTVGTFVLLSGSLTGMTISIISGLMFSIILSVGKKFTPKRQRPLETNQ